MVIMAWITRLLNHLFFSYNSRSQRLCFRLLRVCGTWKLVSILQYKKKSETPKVLLSQTILTQIYVSYSVIISLGSIRISANEIADKGNVAVYWLFWKSMAICSQDVAQPRSTVSLIYISLINENTLILEGHNCFMLLKISIHVRNMHHWLMILNFHMETIQYHCL